MTFGKKFNIFFKTGNDTIMSLCKTSIQRKFHISDRIRIIGQVATIYWIEIYMRSRVSDYFRLFMKHEIQTFSFDVFLDYSHVCVIIVMHVLQ